MVLKAIFTTSQNKMANKIIDREQEIVFTNFTEEGFLGTWNKKLYELKSGKSYYLPFYLAEHFAKHLVTRELNRKAQASLKEFRQTHPGIDRKEIDAHEQSIIGNINLRQQMMDKCIETQEPEATNLGIIRPREVPQSERVLKTELRSADLIASKGVPASEFRFNKPKTEDSFEGLADQT